MAHFLSKEKRQLLALAFASKEKRQLLAQAHTRTRLSRESTIARRDPTALVPLSFVQQRLWFLHHLDPTKGHCNTPVAVSLTGELKAEALVQTLREVVRRHDSFRTVFPLQNGEPCQVVSQDAEIDLSAQDLSSLAPSERERAARAIIHQESIRPFDVVAQPCVRFRILCLSEKVHWLLLVPHHMVFDTWSMGVFSREMALIYEAFREGKPSSLPDLDIQYSDFIKRSIPWLSLPRWS